MAHLKGSYGSNNKLLGLFHVEQLLFLNILVENVPRGTFLKLINYHQKHFILGNYTLLYLGRV